MIRKMKVKLSRKTAAKKPAPVQLGATSLLAKIVEILKGFLESYKLSLALKVREKELARRENLVQCEMDAIDNVKKRLSAREDQLESRADELQELEEDLAKEQAQLAAKKDRKVDVTDLVNRRFDLIEEALDKVPASAQIRGYAIVQEGSGEPRIREVSSKREAEQLLEDARNGKIDLIF